MTKTAFINVYDKKGIVEFADGLRQLGYEIFSSASTLELLCRADVNAQPISDERQILYPAINAILNITDSQRLPKPHIVVANLYPLSQIIAQDNFTFEEARQYLDVANSALIRSAAKSFSDTIIVCDPGDYKLLLDALKDFGDISEKRKRRLAAKAYHYCAYYDGAIAQYLAASNNFIDEDEIVLSLKKVAPLSCGENPHQRGALYALKGSKPKGMAAIKILQGRTLNYNHYRDIDLACSLAGEFHLNACVIIKHAHISSMAWGEKLSDIFKAAFDSDIKNSSGGIAVFNRKVSLRTAKIISEEYLEGIVAPEYSKDALLCFKSRKKLKIISVPLMFFSPDEAEIASVSGGILMEEKDISNEAKYKTATKKKPDSSQFALLEMAQKISKHAKSHAAVFVQDSKIFGISDRQADCIESIRIAAEKIRKNHPIIKLGGCLVLACDSSMNKECIAEAIKCGVSAIIQPGLNSSRENAECIAICDDKNIAMVFTGRRHLRQ
ncbi:MAG: hypothetical protein L6300_18235 [Syntrophaceae bacterium]|nr:hypothetical protein [Syntrophaceae bacterium]